MIDLDAAATIRFNDSAAMLEATKSGAGLCLSRLTLVTDALADGSLKQLWMQELHDGLRYYAVCSNRTIARRAVDLFMNWLASEFGSSTEANVSMPSTRKT
jgi:LysR family glycine cleavage system transcriptional activator